jgi:hypothetical protein
MREMKLECKKGQTTKKIGEKKKKKHVHGKKKQEENEIEEQKKLQKVK